MLIITWRPFWNSTTIITWFVNDKALKYISFFAGFSMGIGYVLYLYNERKKKTALKVKPGGIDLDDCIEPDRAYEVVNPELQRSIRIMLDQTRGFLVIEPALAIMGICLSNRLEFQFAGLGISVLKDGILKTAKTFLINFALGGAAGGGALWSLLIYTSTPLGMALILTGAVGMGTFFTSGKIQHIIEQATECPRYIQEVPTILVPPSPENPEGTLIAPISSMNGPFNPDVPRMFIDSVDQKLRIEEKKFLNCDSIIESNPSLRRSVNPDLRKKSTISQKCQVKSKYVPLHQRTKTLNDVKKRDDTVVRNAAQPGIERYNRKAEKFRTERLRIMNNRKSHEQIKDTNLYEHDYDL